MQVLSLTERGTDVMQAALKLGTKFKSVDLYEAYGQIRLERNDPLPQYWKNGIRNEMQRLSSDCSRFHVEHRLLDLLAMHARGIYSIREDARPRLLEAANRSGGLLQQRRLIVPLEGDSIIASVGSYNHLIGRYAQQMLMANMVCLYQARILHDTSSSNSYDFVFTLPERTLPPQTMESKGTRTGELNFSLTPNEMEVLVRNNSNYWLGVVCNIKIDGDGNTSGGELTITEPPVLERWHLAHSMRIGLRRQHIIG